MKKKNKLILLFGLISIMLFNISVEAQRTRWGDEDEKKEVNPINGFFRVPDAERALKTAEARDQILVFYSSREKAGTRDEANRLKAPMAFSSYRNMAKILIYPAHGLPETYKRGASNYKKIGGKPGRMFFVGPKGMPLGTLDPLDKRDETKFMAEHVANLLKWWASTTKEVDKLKRQIKVGKYSEVLERVKEIEEEDRISTKMVLSEPKAIIEMMRKKKKKGELTTGPQQFFEGLHDEMFKLVEEDAKMRLKKAKEEVVNEEFSKAKITLFRIIQQPVEGIPAITEAQQLYKEIEEALKKR